MKLKLLGAVLAVGLNLTAALAQEYPSRVITMVVPFAAGGPGDTIARLIGQAMSQTLKQQIIIENALGAGGTIGTHRVARAAPDGYTLLLMHTGQATSVSLYRKLPYDPVEDFEKIGLVTDVSMLVVGKPNLPPNDLKELVAYIRERGDQVLYAHSGIGSAAHLCGLVLMNAIGAKTTVVPYKGGGPALNDLIAGHIDFYCDPATGPTPHVQAGKIKAYAVTTRTRLATLPNVPTTAETGFPDIEVSTWYGLYAPRGTPKPIIDRLVDALQSALRDPLVVSRFAELSMEPVGQNRATPAALDLFLRAEVAKWAPIIRNAGVQAD
jgi:tripartite-type tricarboxylate transporter receptor subunit TctC